MNREDIQLKTLDLLLNVERGSAALSGGTGKTLIGLQHMNIFYNKNSKFLVVAPKRSIFESWKDDAKKFNFDYLIPHITFSTYLSLNKQSNNYDIIYLDECHNLKLSHNAWLSKFTKKMIGLTGTPPKDSRSERGFMNDKYCPIVYSYTTDEAVDHNILNDYRIIVHLIELDKNKNIRMSTPKSTWDTSEIQTYNYWTKRVDESYGKSKSIAAIQRMKAMQGFLSKEHYAKKLALSVGEFNKILVFASTQEQAGRISPKTFHSKNKFSNQNLEDFKNNNTGVLCAVEQLSEGINIPNLKYGIITHSYGNERKASQKIFRFLRLNPEETCTIHILCYKDSVDETWVTSALEEFNQTKIQYVNR